MEINVQVEADEDKPWYKRLFATLEREDGYISLIRCMAAISFICFWVIVFYLLYLDKTFTYFSEIMTATGAIIFATLGNKGLDIWQQVRQRH